MDGLGRPGIFLHVRSVGHVPFHSLPIFHLVWIGGWWLLKRALAIWPTLCEAGHVGWSILTPCHWAGRAWVPGRLV